MRIASVEIHAVTLPFCQPVSDSLGTYDASNHCIVIIRTESDLYGAGEAALAWYGGTHSLLKEMKQLWAPLLIGEDGRNINALMRKLKPHAAFSNRHLLGLSAFEAALYDLAGKAAGVPVYQLLGGKVRDCIPLTGGVNIGAPEEMEETAMLKVSEGYKELKIKVGPDQTENERIIRRIRAAIPDQVKLRVDANMSWTDVKEAATWINVYYEYGVHIVEQPLAADRLEDLAWLRSRIKAKLLLDESVWGPADAKRCLEMGACDLLHVYLSEAGGLSAARTIFELAELYHLSCTIGSMPEGRVGTAASLHVAAAMNNLSEHASDIRGFTVYQSDVVMQDFRLSNGTIVVEDQPGMGVAVDFEKLNYVSVEL